MLFNFFKKNLIFVLFFTLFNLNNICHAENIISSTGNYIKNNGYFYKDSGLDEIFEAGIDAINNTSEDILITYKYKNNGNQILVEINDNGIKKNITIQNNKKLNNITSNLFTIVRIIENQNIKSHEISMLRYVVANAILQQVDEYSSVIEPEEMEQFLVETKGTFGGLGIVIGIKNNELTVISPIDNTPAFRAGIKANDVIRRIDSIDATGLSLTQAIKILRGEKGTNVILYVDRKNEDELIRFNIVRDIIKVESVTSKKIDQIGYIKVNSFQVNSYEDFLNNLKNLRSEGINGLIVDLRGNPGGLLDQAIKISNIFLKDKLIVSTRGKDSRMDIDFFTKAGVVTKYLGPLVVLIDNGSASASEIVAGALKNNNRAVIIGEKSFGKGTVQEVYKQNDGSAVKLTIAEYLNPNEYKVDKNGVIPHIEFINTEIKDKKIFFNNDFKDYKENDNYKIIVLKKDEGEDEDYSINISKKILNSKYIKKINFNENIKNFLTISEELIYEESIKLTNKLFREIKGFDIDEKENSIKNVIIKEIRSDKLISGKTNQIKFEIFNSNNIKVKNLFIKLTSSNKTLDNKFYFINELNPNEIKEVEINVKIPDWVESADEKITFSITNFVFSPILKPKLNIISKKTMDIVIQKEQYEFPKLFYSIKIEPKERKLRLNINLDKTKNKCKKCYLKIYSKNKNLRISKRNILLENISNENYIDDITLSINKKNKMENIIFNISFHDEDTNEFYHKEINMKLDEILSFKPNNKKQPHLIKDRDSIYSEPSFDHTLLSKIKSGNLIYSTGSTNNFILMEDNNVNYWIPKNSCEKISENEKSRFLKAIVIQKKDSPPKIDLIKKENKTITYKVSDSSKLKIINYFLNDKKIGLKETNLLTEEIMINYTLPKKRNKISILAVDENHFKTIKNFYITKDEG